MCDHAPMPIEFVIGPPSTAAAATYTGNTQTLYAFLSNAPTCVFSESSGGINNDPNNLIGTGAPVGNSVFFNGSTPFVFPSGGLTPSPAFPDVNRSGFTTADLLTALKACPPYDGIQLGTYYICVGVNTSQTKGLNNGNGTSSTATSATTGFAATTSGSDPFAFVQFQVDTVPPPVPSSIVAKSLDSRCDVKVNYDASTLDAYYLRVKATSDPVNLTLTDLDQNPNGTCDAWTGDVITRDVNIYGETSGSETLTIRGDNGTLYGFCAQTIDYLGNVSVPTPVTFGRPRPECDLFKCYPDTLQTGFCGATLPPSAYAVCGALALWRAARKRRLRGIPQRGRPECY
jgi:hypothetical protein